MLISFFEEFPSTRNLSKLRLVTWPTKLYIAAKSAKEFEQIQRTIRGKNVKEVVYWPILSRKEGYWISPFSQRKALLRIFHELHQKTYPVMLDLELPTTKNPLLYLTQAFNFFRNKKLINNFINAYPGDVYLAEYYPEGKRKERILTLLGLHYTTNKAKIIKMVYHSLHHFNKQFITEELQKGKKEWDDRFLVAYGTMATGIEGWEPNITATQLEEDLKIAKDVGIREVVIYRLGGLNKEYLKIIKKMLGDILLGTDLKLR